MVQFMAIFVGRQQFKLFLNTRRKILQIGQTQKRGLGVGGQWHFQNAGGTRVGRLNDASGVQHNHASSQVVQNGLQVFSGCAELRQTAFYGASRVRQLLRHFREGAGQTTQFVIALQGVFGA